MSQIQISLSISDIIGIISTIISTVVAIISIYYSHKAVKIASQANELTAKITEESNRPVLALYLETIEIENFHKYVVLKNFGNVPAKILDLKFLKSIDELDFNMSSLIGYTVAPKQKFMHYVDTDFQETVIVNIIYETLSGQTYDEIYQIKFDAHSKLLWVSDGGSDKNRKLFKNTAEAVIKALK